MRRLADLAFLFQLYEIAYQTYHQAKKDFNNDHAWLHYAGALVRNEFYPNCADFECYNTYLYLATGTGI